MNYIFIGGCARSGTTALQRVLTTGQNVVVGIERYLGFKDKPDQFGPELFEESRFYDPRPGDTWYDDLAQFPYYGATRALFAGASAVGDKIPLLNPLFPAIAERFPDARVVFIVRNLFDVANSFQVRAAQANDETWPASRDYRRACKDWNESLHGLADWSRKIKVLVVDYESFFAGAARIDAIARFLGLDPRALREAYETEIKKGQQRKPSISLSPGQRQYIASHGDFAAYGAALALARRWRFPGFVPQNRALALTAKYAREDERVVTYDCQMFCGRPVRGPLPDDKLQSTVVALGAASTFGRLVRVPYVVSTASRVGRQALNLGYGGARAPLYYLDRELMKKVNQCSCAIIEVFSARGTGTALVESRDHVSTFLRRRDSGEDFTFAPAFYARLAREWRRYDLAALVRDIQDCYMAELNELLRQIKVPKVLVWFSQRPPPDGRGDVVTTFTDKTFPHFVNRRMVDGLAAKCDAYVEFVSQAGLPSSLVDRQTGEPVPVFAKQPDPARNDYYPSQEMHDGLADALVPVLQGLLGKGSGT
jgi:hypothetical protein